MQGRDCQNAVHEEIMAKGDNEPSAWRRLFPLDMKSPWLYGTGAKVELGSGLLYGEDTCAARAR